MVGAAFVPIAVFGSVAYAGAAPSTTVPVYAEISTPQDSGLAAVAGTPITVSATGTSYFAESPPSGCGATCNTDPSGAFNGGTTTVACTSGCYINGDPIGELVARVGTTGAWTAIGKSGGLTPPSSGELYFAYNDGGTYNGGADAYNDNHGSYATTVSGAVPGGPVAPVGADFTLWADHPTATLTGIVVNPGDTYDVTASGTGYYAMPPSGCGGQCDSQADGTSSDSFAPPACGDSTCALQGAPVGELLYRLGDSGAWQPAGTSTTVTGTSTSSGQLEFIYNDGTGAYYDNYRGYTVAVTEAPTSALPESPYAVALPFAGLALAGGIVVRRRKRTNA